MATKQVTAGSSRIELPVDIEAGAAAGGAPAAGGAASPKAAQAAAKAGKAAKSQATPRPTSEAASRLGKSVDKALGKAARPAPKAAPAAPKSAAGYATSATKATGTGEWAFLSDKNLSIEDKLFRFLMLAQKKNDAELVKKMEEYKARFTADGKTTDASGSKGSSFFDAVKALVPAVGLAEKLIGETGIKKLVGQIAGPALAAAAAAVGMPALAPLALQLGGNLAQMAFQEVGGKAGAAPGAKADANSPDEKVAMFELQRLAEKQQAMFTAISNTLKCMHDTQMSAINNIR